MVVSVLGAAFIVSDGGVELCVLYVVVGVLGGVIITSEGAEEA